MEPAVSTCRVPRLQVTSIKHRHHVKSRFPRLDEEIEPNEGEVAERDRCVDMLDPCCCCPSGEVLCVF